MSEVLEMIPMVPRQEFPTKKKIMTAKVLERPMAQQPMKNGRGQRPLVSAAAPAPCGSSVDSRVLEVGMISALVDENLRIARRGRSFMLDVCGQCGSGVSQKLLRCSDGTAVFHRECANGHKQHRTSGESEQQPDPQRASSSFVMVEACDCN
jgi:hypothetical protein